MSKAISNAVAAEASDLATALSLAQTASFDVAILDINLNGQRIDPVAEAISLRKLPFMFTSGYGEAGRAERFRDSPTLQKPFNSSQLAEAIEAALRPARMTERH